MTSTTELLPCPFCGGEARIFALQIGKGWRVVCSKPFCAQGPNGDTEAEAIAAWNTRATHGTLTAEQVRECVQVVYFEGYSDGSVNRGQHLEETDWQAIADKLNARAERTCHDANTRFNAWTCSECKCTVLLMFDDYGEPTLNVDGVASVPNYCPNCGARVIGG